MTSTLEIIWAALLVVVVLISWVLNLVGIPGNWLIVIATAIYAVLIPPGHRVSLGWPIVASILVLALVGELIEFVAGAVGVKKAGGSRRAAVFALAGGLTGGLVGVFVGVPVPVIGSIVAALFFGGIGALVGAMMGDVWAGSTFKQSWRVGQAAFWGRLLGSLGKIIVGSIMVSVVLAALVV